MEAFSELNSFKIANLPFVITLKKFIKEKKNFQSLISKKEYKKFLGKGRNKSKHSFVDN